MKSFLAVLTVFLLCLSVTTDAAERVRLKLADVVRPVGPKAFSARAISSRGDVTAVVKDRHLAARDCSATWYETDVTCAGTVQFKGFGDCDRPVSAELIVTDCGTVKKTVIEFCSGKQVEVSKGKGNKVTVDYDR